MQQSNFRAINKAVLVTVADKDWIIPAKQLFSSVYWNSGWKGDYMLITDDSCPEKDLEWFKNKGIIVKRFPSIKNRYKSPKRFHNIVLTRLCLFTNYFRKWEKIIYLDADIIVRSSLDDMLKIKGFGAVMRNFPLFEQFKKEYQKSLSFILGRQYNFNAPSFNAGVLVVDTSIIRKRTFRDLLYLFRKYEKYYLFYEQAMLNLYFYDNWAHLPEKYNVLLWQFLNHSLFEPSLFSAHVLHFNTKKKPWHKNNPFHKEWEDNLLKADLIRPSFPLKSKSPIQSFYRNIFVHFWIIRFGIIQERIHHFIFRYILGRLGFFLRRNFPPCYAFLKKIKRSLRKK